MADLSQRILIVVGDMRPLADEVRQVDVVIKVPLDGTPQVLCYSGIKPVVARSHRKKPKGWYSWDL